MFQNHSFRFKLLFLCFIFVLISTVISAVSIVGMDSTMNSYEQVSSVVLPSIATVDEMYLYYRKIRINLRSLAIPGITPSQENEFVDLVKQSVEKFEAENKKYEALPFDPGQKQLHDALMSSWFKFKAIGMRVLKAHEENTKESKEQMVQIFLKDCPEAAADFTQKVEAIKNFHKKAGDDRVNAARDRASHTHYLMLLTSCIGIFMAIAFGLLLSNRITQSMVAVVNRLIENVKNVNAESTQVAGAAQELSESALEQSSSLQQTAASLEEITSMIQKSSGSASAAATSSVNSRSRAEEGRSAVEEMMGSMSKISESNNAIVVQVDESNKQMADIVRLIEDIGGKTKVINEIVFQTKLLSFNASVEAARAGEHGKGFSVVASEIGNLAQMSGNAAREIGEMLASSIKKVDTIVEASKNQIGELVEKGKERVSIGVQTAEKCSSILNTIVTEVSSVSSLAQEISQATTEQSHGVAEINKAITEMDSIVRKNASTSTSFAQTAETISSQAHSLNESVNDLLKIVYGEPRVSVTQAA